MARTRKSQLVCQHLENISRKALEQYQDVIRDYVRGRQGIYALYRKRKLYYLGLASNLNVRLKQHLADKHGLSWDSFSIYVTKGDTHMKEIESLLLRVIRPSGNKVKGKFVRSQDLRNSFKREIGQRLKIELGLILGADGKQPKRRKREPHKPGEAQLAPYVGRRIPIRARYKGKMIRGIIRRDGMIRYNKKLYKTPSAAAKAVIDSGTRNGWMFWQYQQAPGHWVALKEIKKS